MFHITSVGVGKYPVFWGLQMRWAILGLSIFFGSFILFIVLQMFSIVLALGVCIPLVLIGIYISYSFNKKYGTRGFSKFLANRKLHTGVHYKSAFQDIIISK
ncbi:MAG: DUF4133 domain-containing protein [Bacteroidales bacterium]|nr:DUF4133 domain-containing protein [Candidatus Scybalocola fimicaballi]